MINNVWELQNFLNGVHAVKQCMNFSHTHLKAKLLGLNPYFVKSLYIYTKNSKLIVFTAKIRVDHRPFLIVAQFHFLFLFSDCPEEIVVKDAIRYLSRSKTIML